MFLILLCALIPTTYVAKQFAHRPDLTQLIAFGEKFEPRALPEIRQMHPATATIGGYDGQFYAQIALDPTLQRPDLLKALDNPGLRDQRIFLPALAHVLGLGRPRAVLFIYALLNLAFWYLLLAVLVWRLPAAGIRSFLLLFAIMLTSGALLSVENALTDLPEATLGFIGLGLGEISAALVISLAILTKPTGGLFLLRYLTSFPGTPREWGKKAVIVLLALTLPLLWQLYLWHILKSTEVDKRMFSFPFDEWWSHIARSWKTLTVGPRLKNLEKLPWQSPVVEALALFSLTAQAVYLLLRPYWRDPVWRVGAAFAVLFFCLGHENMWAQINYTRTVLPMTIAFNFLLMKARSTPLFLPLFVAGNVGLFEGLRITLAFLWN